MKILFIGGTGTISAAITRKLLQDGGHEVYLVNRGNRNDCLPDGYRALNCDINDEAAVARLLDGKSFDVVADFIAFVPSQLERDYRLFSGRTGQFIFISSATVYQKPPADYRVNEGVQLANPYWKYARDKIACEEYLMRAYRDDGFPVTIIRPSHTYDERSIPLGVHGDKGSWQVAKRIMEGKPVIIQGDGTSLWTMTHNSDFADAFIGLMGNIHAIGEAVQITSDETLTWNQIYNTIAAALGVKLNPCYAPSSFLDRCSSYDFNGGLLGDKANSLVFDNAKLKRLVPGFAAKVRFDRGVRMTIDNVLASKEHQVEDPEFDAWCDRVAAALEEAVKKV